jgi:hypothetical protein
MEICSEQILVAMRARGIMDIHPAYGDERFADAVPMACAAYDLDVSRGAPLPGHGETGAVSRLGHHLLGGSQFLTFHARPAHGATRAWWWRLIQGGITITRAD